ncbi:MAG: hypothetical protein CMB80_31965 [Flammeovirgaceae bacterium]|nr:hypothetical protein [Flammeovirgaceae bacterium]
MRKLLLMGFLFMGILAQSQSNSDYVNNVVRVKFSNDLAFVQSGENLRASSSNNLVTGVSTLDDLNARFTATKMQRVFPTAGKFEDKHREHDLHLWYDIFVGKDTDLEELIQKYGELEVVITTEKVTIYKHEDFKGEVLESNDPRLADQWHYDNYGQTGGRTGADISLIDAWSKSVGNSRVVVSVHDSGLDIYHPDIKNRVWTNEGETPNDGIDNDNNGFIDDYYGYNFAAAVVGGDPTSVYDYGGHGTHTSGTIAAENNNGIGVAGVAGGSKASDGVRIMMMRLGDDYGSPYIYNPAPSFVYAADMGSVISSNSWGGGGYDQSLVDAINYYTSTASSPALNGGIAIFSAGNSSSSSTDYKSELENVMFVAATNHNDQKAWYSNYGSWVDISAPGGETSISYQGVLSTLPNNSYGFYQGTSMACPHVSGVAALMVSKAYGTGLSNYKLFNALIEGTDLIDEFNPNYAGLLGSGRINADKALDLVGTGDGSSNGELIITPLNIVTEILDGESKEYNLRLVNTSEYAIEVELSKENNSSWVDLEAAKLTIPANSVAKSLVTIHSSTIGEFQEEKVLFTYLTYNEKVTKSLNISIYTLGDPDISSVDTLDFPEVYKGYSSTLPIAITNSGTNYLYLSGADIKGSDFSISFEEDTLPPNQTVYYDVTFSPSKDSLIIDTLTLQTNVLGKESFEIILEGYGIPNNPPQLKVTPSNISIVEDYSTYNSTSFTVTNEGEDPLSYSIQVNPYENIALSTLIEADKNAETKKEALKSDEVISNIGDVEFFIESPVNYEFGMAWDGSHLWIREGNSNNIYRFNPETELITDTIVSQASNGVRLDFYDGYLYEHDYRSQIIKYDIEGNIVQELSITSFNISEYGMSVDQNGIWLIDNGNVLNIDPNTGTQLQRYYNSYASYADGMISFDNQILFLRSNSRLYTTTKGYSGYNSSAYINGYSYTGTQDMAFDGEYAWVILNDYGILAKVDIFPNFLYSVYNSSGYLEEGTSNTHTLDYHTYDLSPGRTYYDEVVFTTNSPSQEKVVLKVSGKVNGEPILDTNKDALVFEGFVSNTISDTLIIKNIGSEVLEISSFSIDSSAFTYSSTPVSIEPFSKYTLPISINLAESDTLYNTLTIVSNYATAPIIKIPLNAYFIHPPSISVDVTEFSVEMYEEELDSLPITITNSGRGSLYYFFENNIPDSTTNQSVLQEIPKSISGRVLTNKEEKIPQSELKRITSQSFATTNQIYQHGSQLEDILESLQEQYTSVTNTISNLYAFYGGDAGYSISDGGGDMYDGGNYLQINYGNTIYYSNFLVNRSSIHQGVDGYFTAKFPGLFVFTADLNKEAQSFTIDGNLGADGSGFVDGSVLSFTHHGREYLGFVKRVYDSYDPSVNHLIIVPNNGTVSQSYFSSTNSDYHSIENLNGINRLHYLLFAGSDSDYYSNSEVLDIMKSYLAIVGEETNEVTPETSITDYVHFNTQNKDSGTYKYNVKVVSNDPENPQIEIPTTLTVNSAARINSEPSLEFDDIFVGDVKYSWFTISNEGSLPLIINSYSSTGGGAFSFENKPDTIAPKSSVDILVAFSPTSASQHSTTLSINSNDPVNPKWDIHFVGNGIPSTILSIDEAISIDTIAINQSKEIVVDIKSAGTDTLNYRMIIESYPSFYEIEQQIEQIREQSGVYEGRLQSKSEISNGGNTSQETLISDPNEVAGVIQSTGTGRVLLIVSEPSSSYFNDVIDKLDSVGEFSAIAYYNLTYSSGLTLEDLHPYDAILVYGNYSFSNSEELGNLLADYVDAGGGVVTAMYQHGYIGGRWIDEYEKYTLFNTTSISNDYVYDYAYLSNSSNLDSPLLVNVDTFNLGYYGMRSITNSEMISSDAEIIASYHDNTPLIVAGTNSSVKRVDLNFYPVSSDAYWGMWESTTDGARILSNALHYVSGGISGSEVNWLTSSEYEVNDIPAGETYSHSFQANMAEFEEGWVGARARLYSNDSRDYMTYQSHYFDVFVKGEAKLDVPDTLNIGEISSGFTASKRLKIRNLGTGATNIVLQIDSTSEFYSEAANDTLTIRAYNSYDYVISANTSELGVIQDVVTLIDLETGNSTSIHLMAEVTPPGIIRTSPENLVLDIDFQSSAQSDFYIHNDGEGDLNFILNSYRLPQQLDASEMNNTSLIEFGYSPDKGELDTRSGHEVISGFGNDPFGYQYVDSKQEDGPGYQWTDISESGTLISLGDDSYSEVELDFEFPFYGIRFDKMAISSNGFIGFGDNGNNNPVNQQIPSSSAPNGFIAPFWKDLAPQNGGSVYVSVEDNKAIIQYSNVPDYDNTGTYTFQVVIYQSGDILFYYNSLLGNVTDATVGLENPFGNTGLQVAFNTEYLESEMAISFSYPTPQINPELTKGTLAPGDSVSISFEFNAQDYLGGSYEEFISIVCNDTVNSFSSFPFTVNISGTSLISAFADTLAFDTTYINQTTTKNMWFRNDSVGVMEIQDVLSSNDDFKMLFPSYYGESSEEELLVSANYSPIAEFCDGMVIGLNESPLAIKLYSEINGEKELHTDLDWYTEDDTLYFSGNGVVNLDLLHSGNVYLEVFTMNQPSGLGKVNFVPKTQVINPYEYSSQFVALYTPSSEANDTTLFTVSSNAINSNTFRTHGFGTGLKSAASFSVDVDRLEESLTVGDSVQRSFVVSNIGNDTVSLNVSISPIRFDSKFSPIQFETSNQLSSNQESIIENETESGRIPNKDTTSDQVLEETNTITLLESLEGTFYGVFYGEYPSTAIVEGNLASPDQLIEIMNNTASSFIAASEFVFGSSTELITLDVSGVVRVYDMADNNTIVLGQIDNSVSWSGMTTDPITGELYISSTSSIYTLDPNLMTISYVGSTGFGTVAGIAMNNNGEMYGYTRYDEFISINKSTGQGTYIGYIGFDANFGQDMAYDPKTDAFYMAAFNGSTYTAELRRVDISTGSTEFLGYLGPNNGYFQQLGSLAFPSSSQTRTFTLSLKDTLIAPGASVEFPVWFNAKDLANGEYKSSVKFVSNDYSKAGFKLPLKLNVSGNHPEIGEYPETVNFGYHTVMDTIYKDITITNTGKAILDLVLQNEETAFYSEYYVGDTLSVNILESVTFPVWFIPNRDGSFEYNMKWSTNDPNLPLLNLNLSGGAEKAPYELELEFDSMHIEMLKNQTTELQFPITSVGEDSLHITLDLESIPIWINGDSVNYVLGTDSTIYYSFTIDTDSIDLGHYTTGIRLNSNDPLYSIDFIQITLDLVNGQMTQIQDFEDGLVAINESETNIIYVLDSMFSDADGDSLMYSFENSDIVAIELTNDSLVIQGQTVGMDTITFTAVDGFGDTIVNVFHVMVNDRPTTSGISDYYTRVDDGISIITDLDDHFDDPTNELTFKVVTDLSDIGDLLIDSEHNLILKPSDIGVKVVTISAFDGYHYQLDSFELVIDEPLSIADELQSSLSMYPNPVQNSMNISYTLSKPRDMNIEIIDLSGKVVHQLAFKKQSKIDEEINMKDLNAGIYLIKFYTEEDVIYIQKVIKR